MSEVRCAKHELLDVLNHGDNMCTWVKPPSPKHSTAQLCCGPGRAMRNLRRKAQHLILEIAAVQDV